MEYDFTRIPKLMTDFTLRIDGMHSASCIRRVAQVLANIEGIHVQEVLLGVAKLSSVQDPPPVDLVASAIFKAGYRARLEKSPSSKRLLALVL